MQDALKKAKSYAIFSEREAEKIRSVFEKNRSIFSEIKKPRLLHSDLWEGNILIRTKPDIEVCLILDMDRAFYGDIDFEFSQEWMPIEHLKKGYGADLECYKNLNRIWRRKLYQLGYYIQTAYIGIAEYAGQQLYRDSKKRVQALCKELL